MKKTLGLLILAATLALSAVLGGTAGMITDAKSTVAAKPLKYKNVMYALHFYAATHKDDLRNVAKKALDQKLPIFVSEYSICDASGNGGLDTDSATKWMKLLNENKISYCQWSLCNKNESSAIIRDSVSKTSGFTDGDLSETGKWLKKQLKK